jgi:hypothetical protein
MVSGPTEPDAVGGRSGYRLVGAIDTFVLDLRHGQPVVCLHGVPASSFLTRKLIVELAACGLRGIAFDVMVLRLAGRPGLRLHLDRRLLPRDDVDALNWRCAVASMSRLAPFRHAACRGVRPRLLCSDGAAGAGQRASRLASSRVRIRPRSPPCCREQLVLVLGCWLPGRSHRLRSHRTRFAGHGRIHTFLGLLITVVVVEAVIRRKRDSVQTR